MIEEGLEGLYFQRASRFGDIMGDFTDGVSRYRQEWRSGPYEAYWRFELDGKKVLPEQGREWFANALMNQVQVKYNDSEVWRGYIGRMVLHDGTVTRERDARTIRNAVKAAYTFTDVGIRFTGYTRWFVDFDSLRDFGHFEYVVPGSLRLDGLVDENGQVERDEDGKVVTEVEARAEAEVKLNKVPMSPPTYGEEIDTPYLEFWTWGPQVWANFIKVSDGLLTYYDAFWSDPDNDPWEIEAPNTNLLRYPGPNSAYVDLEYGATKNTDGSVYTVSDKIKHLIDIVNYHSSLFGEPPLLYYLSDSIQENDRQTVAGFDKVMGAWDAIEEVSRIPNVAGVFFVLKVEPDGLVRYEPLDTTPHYYVEPGVGVRKADGEPPTWDARPEIVKDLDDQLVHDLPDTWLGDASLSLAERVTMRQGAAVASFSPLEFTLADYDAAVSANRQLIKKMRTKNEMMRKRNNGNTNSALGK